VVWYVTKLFNLYFFLIFVTGNVIRASTFDWLGWRPSSLLWRSSLRGSCRPGIHLHSTCLLTIIELLVDQYENVYAFIADLVFILNDLKIIM
jgi:hypothetical protein